MNVNNNAIKRIMADVRSLAKNPSSRYSAAPLEDNVFEWHFSIRGPAGTDFEGGMYHGRILLPAEYPFKPPNFIFLTKTGRFEVGTKICLSITAYHEESWQPAWGVSSMLEAIISFLPSEGMGSIGALEYSKTERQKLARESCKYVCPCCGPIAKLFPEMTEKEINELKAEKENSELKNAGVGVGVGAVSTAAVCGVSNASITECSVIADTQCSNIANFKMCISTDTNAISPLDAITTGSGSGAATCVENEKIKFDDKGTILFELESAVSSSSSSSSSTTVDGVGNVTYRSTEVTSSTYSNDNDITMSCAKEAVPVQSIKMEIAQQTAGELKPAAIGVVKKDVFGQGANKMFLDSDIDAFMAHSIAESLRGSSMEESREKEMEQMEIKEKTEAGENTNLAAIEIIKKKNYSMMETKCEFEKEKIDTKIDGEGSPRNVLRRRHTSSSTSGMSDEDNASHRNGNENANGNTSSQQASSQFIAENHENITETIITYEPDLLDKILTFFLYIIGTAICFVVLRRFCLLWIFYSKNNLFLGYRDL